MSTDPYLDPETGVLRNRLGITNAAELAQAEAELTSFRLIELHGTDLPGRYDLPHLQAFHRYLFADVYAWAGEIRTVSIGKGGLFCLPQYIVSFADEVFGKFAAADYLRGRQRPEFVDGLAELLADINALHPFREGNGRTQRAFLAQVARAAGHSIRWSAMDPGVNIAASQAAHRGDNSLLRAMLDRLVAPSSLVVRREDPAPPLPRKPATIRPLSSVELPASGRGRRFFGREILGSRDGCGDGEAVAGSRLIGIQRRGVAVSQAVSTGEIWGSPEIGPRCPQTSTESATPCSTSPSHAPFPHPRSGERSPQPQRR